MKNFAAEFDLGREITIDNSLVFGTFGIGDRIFGTNNFAGEILAMQVGTLETVLRYKTIEGELFPNIGIRKFDAEGERNFISCC
jgi:hypothetical protein